jgi:hypothetical protein
MTARVAAGWIEPPQEESPAEAEPAADKGEAAADDEARDGNA